MIPDVQLPPDSRIRATVDFKLRAGWSCDPSCETFEGPKSAVFRPAGLPRGARLEYKVQSLVGATSRTLTKAERDLQRHLQVVVPRTASAETVAELVAQWPCAQDVHIGPAPSLPRPPSAPTR